MLIRVSLTNRHMNQSENIEAAGYAGGFKVLTITMDKRQQHSRTVV